mgnify:CR=1 FL=1
MRRLRLNGEAIREVAAVAFKILTPITLVGTFAYSCGLIFENEYEKQDLQDQFNSITQDGIEYKAHGQTSLVIDDENIETYYNFGNGNVVVHFDDADEQVYIWQLADYKTPHALERARQAACNLATKFRDARGDFSENERDALKDAQKWSTATFPLVCNVKKGTDTPAP